MRRVRLKVAPNLVSGPRSSKVAIANVVDGPKNEVLTTGIDEPVAVHESPVPSNSLNLTNEAENAENCSSHSTILPPAKPVMVTEPPVSEITSQCVDKENVIIGVPDEASSENLVNTSANEQNPSAPSLSRYKARNKIRPVITNAPHRIRTFSSASESEDDAAKRRTPLSPVKKSPTKKEKAEATPLSTSLSTPNTVTEKGKKGKKKPDEKTPLELKKAIMRQKVLFILAYIEG